ncbi:MAG: hypothetical protein AAF438_09605, partial [Pseudomonadota bacterium]
KDLGELREITVPSSHDGLEIQGWLTLPPGYEEGTRVPLILEIHGGPFAAYGPHFATDNQLYAAAGYAVLSANPRGSTSVISDQGLLKNSPAFQKYHKASHTLASDLGRLASRAKPGLLVLYHGLYYGEPEVSIIDDVRKTYDGPVVLAADLDAY